MKNWIIAVLVAVIAIGGAVGAFAGTRTVDRVIEIRLWQNVDDPSENHLSIRARGGDWSLVEVPQAHGTSDSGQYAYADLSVVVPVDVDGPNQAALGAAETSGHWSITRLYDPIYDEETVSASTGPEAVLEKVWSGSIVDRPYLQVYCRGDEMQALIYWDKSIFAPVIQNPVPTIRSVPTVWRLDGGVPVTEKWLPATHGRATFAQYPAEFVSQILGGETLIMRATPSNGEHHTLTLDITGFADVMGNLTCYPARNPLSK